jgi:4-amino-4-deoxy-L-arabinose transferase-like glycosyltransferase
MTAAQLVFVSRSRFERLFDALVDPARCERVMALVLAGYAAVWTLYATIAKSSHDIHADMAEMVAWSRQVTLGTPKHPPLAAWLAGAWFDIFPRQDWAFYLLAMVLATLALWAAWRLFARYLPNDKRVVGIALLTLVPFYNFHALKYNANSVLTPLWALLTWWFLRSFDTRRAGWAVLAGVAAAAAMLGKYWSALLIAGLGAAALADPRRDSYLSSPAPYLTLAVATILFTPHVDWLLTHHFATFAYAIDAHSAKFSAGVVSAFTFIGSTLLYIAAPILFTFFAARPGAAAIGDMLFPADPERRTAVIIFGAPFVLAMMIAVVGAIAIDSLWAISTMTLLPVVLLSSPRITIPRSAAVAVLALAVMFPLVMLMASPGIAFAAHRIGVPAYASDYQLVARAVERAWRAHVGDKPLRIVASAGITDGIDFYFHNQPATFDVRVPSMTPWTTDARIRRDGMAMVCPETEPHCMVAFRGYAAHYGAISDEHVVIVRRFFGTDDRPEPYEIAIVPPQAP